MRYVDRQRDRTSYDTFGRVWTPTTPSTESRFAFTGRDLDPESDLYHYRARYYDPATGRFISADPIAFGAGDGNLYRYVDNGPTDGTDPSGLEPNTGHPWRPLREAVLGGPLRAVGPMFEWYNTKVKDNLTEIYREDNRLGRTIGRVLEDGRLQIGFVVESKRLIPTDKNVPWWHQTHINGPYKAPAFVEVGIVWAPPLPLPEETEDGGDRLAIQRLKSLDGIPFARTVTEDRLVSSLDVAAAYDALGNAELIYDFAIPVGGRLSRELILDGDITPDGVAEALVEGFSLLACVRLSQITRLKADRIARTESRIALRKATPAEWAWYSRELRTALGNAHVSPDVASSASLSSRGQRIICLREANADRWLQQLEQQNPGAHFHSRHGAGTALVDQEFRAMSGLRPDDLKLGRVTTSTRFLSHMDEMHALDRAIRLGNSSEPIVFEYKIGEGYRSLFHRGRVVPFGPHYFQTNQARFFFRNGLPYTGYPTVQH